MLCYFMRHGLAGNPDAWRGDDFERPLTGEGVEKMAREAKTIAALGLQFEVIVTSPLLRARQTAAPVARELGMTDRLVVDALLDHSFSVTRLRHVLEKHAGVKSILLVGHQPSMGGTVGALIGGADVEFKKGSLACVRLYDIAKPSGELVFLLPPSVLAR